MSKILKVTLEFDDKILEVEGDEAEKWSRNCESVGTIAQVHGMNAFETNKVNWKVTNK